MKKIIKLLFMLFGICFIPLTGMGDEENTRQFIDAIKDGDKATVKKFLREKKVTVDAMFQNDSALMTAIAHNQKELIDLLLKYGANPNLENSRHETALQTAIYGKRDDMVLLLLQHGANPNILDKNKETSLQAALEKKGLQPKTVITLLLYGGQITLLDPASREELKKLLQSNMGQQNPLIIPSIFNSAQDLSNLLRQIPSPVVAENRIMQHCSAQKCSPTLLQKVSTIFKTIFHEKTKAVSYPLINQPDEFGMTPLHWAAQQGNREAVLLLLSYGAHPFISNSQGLTPSEIALRYGHREIAREIKGFTARELTRHRLLSLITAPTGRGQIALPSDIQALILELLRPSIAPEPGDPGSSGSSSSPH